MLEEDNNTFNLYHFLNQSHTKIFAQKAVTISDKNVQYMHTTVSGKEI